MPVSRQVMQIYAATNRDDPQKRGWLREIPVADVTRWSREFLEFVDAKYPQLEKDLVAKREFTAEIKATMNKALTEFNESFLAAKA